MKSWIFLHQLKNMQILNMPLNTSVQMEIKMKLNCFTPAPWRHHWQPSPSFYPHSALSFLQLHDADWLPHCRLSPQLSCQPMANTLQHRRPPSELDWIDLLGGFVHSFKHQMVSLVYLNETIPTSWNCIKWPKNSFSHRHHLSMYPFISIHP